MIPSISVARTEYRRYLRGKTPWIVGICVIVLSRFAIEPNAEEIHILSDAVVLVNAQVAVATAVPFAAAALGFRSIIRERETGTARILAGTKLTRRQFVLGVAFGRAIALLVPILISTICVVSYDAVQYGRFSLPLLVGFLFLSTVYVFAWMGVIVGLSAGSSSTTRAIILGTVVTSALVFWNDVTLAILWRFATGAPPGDQMAYATAFEGAKWLPLMSAYNVLTNWLFGVPVGPEVAVTQVSEAISETGAFTPTDAPLPAWSGIGFLLVWPVLSLCGGISIFQRTDLATHSRTGIFRALLNRCSSLPRLGGHRFRSITGRGGFIDLLPGSWQPLSRREFHRLVRTPLVWVVGILVFIGGVTSLSPETYVQQSLEARVPLAALQTPLTLIGAIGILFGTFRSVVRERDTGTIRLTAGTAVSRRDTLVGIVLGRAGAFALPIVSAVVLTCLVATPQHGLVPLSTLGVFLGFTLVFVVGMAGLGVSISTILQSQSAAGVVVLVFPVVHLMWVNITNTVYGTLTGTSVSGFAPPDNPLYLLIRWLHPLQLFNVVTNAIIGVPNSAGTATSVISDLQPNRGTNIVVAQIEYGADVPAWYLHPVVAFVQFLLWIIIPLGVALLFYRRRSID